MAFVRAVVNFMVGGALLGILLVSLAGPAFIQWDNTTGSGVAGMCVCSEQARVGANTMIVYQMRGCAAGAVLGVIAGAVFMRLRQKKLAPPA